MKNIEQSLRALQTQIAGFARKHGRDPADIRLVAVSKRQPATAIAAAVAAGQRDFGENYLQEALDKMPLLSGELVWHFIGPLQSNKTRAVAEHFHWLHSLDREKLARRLSEQRPAELAPLNVCLQVNISGEASKSGVSPDALPALAETVATLPGLKLRGLMALPAPAGDLARQRQPFRALHDALTRLKRQGLMLDTLSMGTSADLEAAIAEGATHVRIGTALFGARQ